nr:helix-turn-helix transcriptional regulator [Sphingomonas sp. BT553]
MERRILECLVSGNTANEVSWLLMISLGTVRVHIRHIYEKLDVSSREGLFNKVLYLVER